MSENTETSATTFFNTETTCVKVQSTGSEAANPVLSEQTKTPTLKMCTFHKPSLYSKWNIVKFDRQNKT